MQSDKAIRSHSPLQDLPSVDEMLRTDPARSISNEAGAVHAAALARTAIDSVRRRLQEEMPQSNGSPTSEGLKAAAERNLVELWETEQMAGVQCVINATGVIIHTNLGRAPLSEDARRAVADQAAAYCTLEFDLGTGKRGRRGRRAEELLIELTGAEDALIVNNCAAAAFFVLNVFGAGGEVVISRGELVEIGGDFRVPDVLSQSSATLREVGTTNRTKLADYENAVGEMTRVILRVHPSNYRIVGFTAMPSVGELAALAHQHGLLIYEDLGSGALIDLADMGMTEPIVRDSLAAGVDVVTFSGDKLLGGPQAGIIAGKAEFIDRLRKHPLYRALRVNKMVYAALEATLESYRRGTERSEIPVIRMLSMTVEEMGERAVNFVEQFVAKRSMDSGLAAEVIDGRSAVGGGAAPDLQPVTKLIALSHPKLSASALEQLLRRSDPPIISRIVNDRVVLDLRTVSENEEQELLNALFRI